MTEEQARTKWCPQVAMVVLEGSIVDNRGDYFAGLPCRCIASGCMMWVWGREQTGEEKAKVLWDTPIGEPMDIGYIHSDTEGHCGLIR